MMQQIRLFLLFLLFVGCCTAVPVQARQQLPGIDSSYLNSHYQMRLAFFRQMPDRKNEIVFLGNSITEVGEWQELLAGRPVVNRGISGDVTFGVLARLDEVLASKPKKIFLLIGVNDLKRGLPVELIARNHQRIVSRIREASPRTAIYLQSVLPVHEPMLASIYQKITNARVAELNRRLQALAGQRHIRYVNLHEVFADEHGQLKRELTTDGLHLKATAYLLWVNQLKKLKHL